jgi:hypothetical protein
VRVSSSWSSMERAMAAHSEWVGARMLSMRVAISAMVPSLAWFESGGKGSRMRAVRMGS